MKWGKKIWIVWLSVFLCCWEMRGRGQGFDAQQLILDWQKLTQLKQLLNDMYRGYEIVEKGYTTIRDISHRSFDLHRVFLDGLLHVSPWVRDYFRVKEIINLQRQLVQEYQQAYGRLRSDSHLTASEVVSYSQICTRLLDESGRTLDELAMVLTDGQLRATDQERLGQIDGLHREMTEKLAALRKLNNEAGMVSLQRARDAEDGQEIRKLYGLDH